MHEHLLYCNCCTLRGIVQHNKQELITFNRARLILSLWITNHALLYNRNHCTARAHVEISKSTNAQRLVVPTDLLQQITLQKSTAHFVHHVSFPHPLL
jgi:hypothetical protein